MRQAIGSMRTIAETNLSYRYLLKQRQNTSGNIDVLLIHITEQIAGG